MASTMSDRTMSQRGVRVGMPQFSASDAVAEAYAEASKGRWQANLATSRVETAIYRNPEMVPAFAAAAMAYLCGNDITRDGANAIAASQTIIRRLNDALEGGGSRVTRALLDQSKITQLRLFRQQVRDLMKAAPPDPAANRIEGLPPPQTIGVCNVGDT